MLTEETIIDRIQLVGQFRGIVATETIVVSRDGDEIARSSLDVTYTPGNLSDGSYVRTRISDNEELRSIANMCWTDEIHAAYETALRGGTRVVDENPEGDTDGVNRVFVLANEPIDSPAPIVTLHSTFGEPSSRIYTVPTSDYSIDGTLLTFILDEEPASIETVYVTYSY